MKSKVASRISMAVFAALICSTGGVALAQVTVPSATVDRTLQQYAAREANRISSEANRLQGEATRLSAESARLLKEEKRLLDAASVLDERWLLAKHEDYAGRDRSQRIMRIDADRLQFEAMRLKEEVKQLENEAVRLQKLAQDVEDVFDRMKKTGITAQNVGDVREFIRGLAEALSVTWRPA
jgi:hypothetical protein